MNLPKCMIAIVFPSGTIAVVVVVVVVAVAVAVVDGGCCY